ncbi:hypothetical protein B0H14DRAFT_2561520 [Mycena olivaceomarginata]|nr:hypothetical protein B0H14DRAFT_2561520 [Mycena olivaceomarginata]
MSKHGRTTVPIASGAGAPTQEAHGIDDMGPHPPEFPTTLFDKGGIWVSQGKIWQDIPPHVKRVCEQDFVIPAAMASKILPQDGLSVTGFLDFTVPLPAMTIENPDVSMFFIVQSGIQRFLFLKAANTCG